MKKDIWTTVTNMFTWVL